MSTTPVALQIATALAETEARPLEQIGQIVELLGEAEALALLAQTEQVEAEGGMMLPDGSRKRSRGGVFLYLARKRLPPAQRKIVFAPVGGEAKGEAPDASATPAPRAEPPPAAARVETFARAPARTAPSRPHAPAREPSGAHVGAPPPAPAFEAASREWTPSPSVIDRLPEAVQALLNTPVDALPLRVRADRLFATLGARTLGDLVRVPKRRVALARNAGPAAVQAVQQALEARGLWFGMSDDDLRQLDSPIDPSALTDEQRAIVFCPVDDLPLAPRVRRALIDAGADIVGEIVRWTPPRTSELVPARDLEVIDRVLAKVGLRRGSVFTRWPAEEASAEAGRVRATLEGLLEEFRRKRTSAGSGGAKRSARHDAAKPSTAGSDAEPARTRAHGGQPREARSSSGGKSSGTDDDESEPPTEQDLLALFADPSGPKATPELDARLVSLVRRAVHDAMTVLLEVPFDAVGSMAPASPAERSSRRV